MRGAVVEDVLVDFVTENVEVAALRDGCDIVEFLLGQHSPGGVAGGTDHDQFGLLTDVFFQLLGADTEVVGGWEGDVYGDAAVQPHHRRIGHPGGVEDHDLVAFIERGGQRCVDGPFASGRDHQLVGQSPHVVLALQFGADCVQQLRFAEGGRVVGVAGCDGVEGCLLDMFGCIEIGFAAGQVDNVQALRGQFAALLHH